MSGLALWESGILLWIQENLWGAADGLAVFLSMLGEYGLIWILPTAALLCFPKTRRGGMACAAALILEFLLCNLILKNAVARVRPYDAFPFLQAIGKIPTDLSFPSGHSTSAFAAATAMALCFGKKAGIPALFLAALIALSRLYAGVHYPSDVLAGAVLGVLCGVLGAMISKKFQSVSKSCIKRPGS